MIGFGGWSERRARWVLVALHVPFMAAAPVFTVIGLIRPEADDLGAAALAVVTAGAIGLLQIRHSLAATRGRRPRGWPWSLLLLVALAYAPMFRFTWNWISIQWFVVASAALLLRGPLAVVAVAAPILGTAAVTAVTVATVDDGTPAQVVVFTLYGVTALIMGAAALYGATRLVRAANELEASRTELAQLAVEHERLRVSRDLHDLLGQSLSAVSLKGDLAIRLLPRDVDAARAEIEGLTEVARRALHDMRAVTGDAHAVSLAGEVEAAAALLGSAGVGTHVDVDVDVDALARPVEEVLAWAVREGTTNVLRHSDARTCWFTVRCRDGAIRLEIVNDGVRGPGGEGSGLAGLSARARALSGAASASCTPDGRFHLLVELPRDGP